MSVAEADIDAARHALVDDLVQRRIIRTPGIERAFRKVQRHVLFTPPYRVPADPLATAFTESDDPRVVYADTALGLDTNKTLTSDPPSTVAEQIEHLAPSEGMRVLHVGTGSGYCTALLAELVGEAGTVVGVEYEEDLAEIAAANLARALYTIVTIRQGDGALGVPEAAPFERILVSAGAADIPPQWVVQLEDGGRLVLPLCAGRPLASPLRGGAVLTVEKMSGTLYGSISAAAFYAPLEGLYAPTTKDGAILAEGLIRWFALEDFLRIEPPIRIVMSDDAARIPDSASVPWLLQMRSAVMWVEPN
jgi:protein-L-isoaspartate(D-aspartate) O-methyltransferase